MRGYFRVNDCDDLTRRLKSHRQVILCAKILNKVIESSHEIWGYFRMEGQWLRWFDKVTPGLKSGIVIAEIGTTSLGYLAWKMKNRKVQEIIGVQSWFETFALINRFCSKWVLTFFGYFVSFVLFSLNRRWPSSSVSTSKWQQWHQQVWAIYIIFFKCFISKQWNTFEFK